MKKSEILIISLTELKSNKLRTALTMLGIVFGVAAVIAMMSIGEGARQETIEQIELMGTNNIIVNKIILKQKTKEAKTSFSPGLTTKDADAIMEINPYVQKIVHQREIKNNLTYKSNIIEARIIGTTPDYVDVLNSKLEYGKFFKSYDVENAANVCVLGSGIREQLFKFENPIGKKIKLGDLWFDIIGVVASKNITSASAEGLGIRNFNEDIYVPFTTMAYKMDKLEEQSELSGGFYYYFSKNASPESQKAFSLIKQINKETQMLLTDIQAYQIYLTVKKTEKIPGDIAEVGAYKGGSAKIICEMKKKKSLYLFDTFEGLPDLSKIDNQNQFRKGEFFASFESVKNYLKKYSNVFLYKGLFPLSAKPIQNKKFSFVHLDVDLYESTLNCLKFFYPRMNKGGVIISHDYPDSKGVKRAIDGFFKDKPEIITELPGCGQCLIVKI